jgi:hypothetical protein
VQQQVRLAAHRKAPRGSSERPRGVPRVRSWESPSSDADVSLALVQPEPACHAGVAPTHSEAKKRVHISREMRRLGFRGP